MKNIVICGDSYSIGIGCHDLVNDPYGSLLSKNFNCNLINYAKGSSTNWSIYMQVKYAIENIKDIEFLCIGVTCNYRTEWFPDKSKNLDREITNADINYHQYPPYGEHTYPYLLENPMKNDSNYTGEILTENYYGVVSYVNDVVGKQNNFSGYWKKFDGESDKKMILLRDYYLNFFDCRIQKHYDFGMITMSHLLLKNNGIKHFVLTCQPEFEPLIPKENLVYVDWGYLVQKYPDDLKTLHTSAEGHRVVYDSIIKKIEENK